MLKVRNRKRSYSKKGFGNSKESIQKSQKRYWIAIELNVETFNDLELEDATVDDLIELHHVSILKVESKKDLACLTIWCDAVSSTHISPEKLLAEIYVITINDHAFSAGANVARIYHNSHLGDNRIRSNGIIHVFDESGHDIPYQAVEMMKKYVAVEKIVPGDQVTLRNRLGK